MIYVEKESEIDSYYEYLSEGDGIALQICRPMDGNWGAYAVINDETYVFADEFSGYYVSALSAPFVVLFDLNNDGTKDIVIWVQDISEIGIGMTQNAYISDETGYTELGSMTWSMHTETHAFEYSVALCDDYMVHLSIPAYEIDTYVPMDEAFATVATDLGILNKKGKITEYGLDWMSGDNQCASTHIPKAILHGRI